MSQNKWYQDAIIYQLNIKAFYDSNKDGIGDFQGAAQRLYYLKELGVTAVWLMPFYPSPLRDDGYDISDYYDINPIYGTIDDFKTFLSEAKRLGIRVITELVLNHTSDQHPWFQAARNAPQGSKERDFYVWSDTPNKYSGARIIFQDFEHSNWTFDTVANAYFWHRFYSHQPDLNFENPEVKKAIFEVVDYWLGMGVDGLRLDAVPYLFEKEGTNCENLPETHNFLKELRAHIDSRYPDKMLLAEANQWAEEAVSYYGNDDECHMCFHFPLMPRMFMAVEKEDRFPITDILGQTPEIPENSQWAIFLRNHDELTLEMVTDDDRDFMYNAYASESKAKINLGIRRRLAPLLGNNRKKIELLNSLLFSLPGTPIIYYGDEIGMGDNIYLGDRNGVRTPFQWSVDKNAGFSQASTQQLYLPLIVDHEYHFEAVNVENQRLNKNSLLWWMKKIISIKKEYKSLTNGKLKILHPHNHRVLAFMRITENEKCLVIANLSRYVQYVDLDLSEYAGDIPVEVFGKTHFPVITERPMPISLGAFQYFWFELVSPTTQKTSNTVDSIDKIIKTSESKELFKNEQSIEELKYVLWDYFSQKKNHGDEANEIVDVEIKTCTFPLDLSDPFFMFQVTLSYLKSDSEISLMPLVFVSNEQVSTIQDLSPTNVIAKITNEKDDVLGFLVEGYVLKNFRKALLKHLVDIGDSKKAGIFEWKGENLSKYINDEIIERTTLFQQRNQTMVFEGGVVLRFLNNVEKGILPEVELADLFKKQNTSNETTPALLGELKIKIERDDVRTAILAHQYVSNKRNMFDFTTDELMAFYENILLAEGEMKDINDRDESVEVVKKLSVNYLQMMEFLGKRLGELHVAVGNEHNSTPAFRPETVNELGRRSYYQTMRESIMRSFGIIEDKLNLIYADSSDSRFNFFDLKKKVIEQLNELLKMEMGWKKIRVHGNFELRSILFTGRDFVFIGFGGSSIHRLSTRKIKKHPYFDLATLINSLQKANEHCRKNKSIAVKEADRIEKWMTLWLLECASSLLSGYNSAVETSHSIPNTQNAGHSKLLFLFFVERILDTLTKELMEQESLYACSTIAMLNKMLKEESHGPF